MPKLKNDLLPSEIKKGKLIPWTKFKFLRHIKLTKGSKAGVVINGNGRSKLFILNTFAMLDLLSDIDEPLSNRLSIQDYHSKTINPAGWLIDEIESQLPLNPKLAASLKKAVTQANKKGWIPFEQIQSNLKQAL